MAFMGLETVRGQHSFNTFCVQSNRFIDLTINSHTNPFNLASSRLLRESGLPVVKDLGRVHKILLNLTNIYYSGRIKRK